jgi:hypothetical protein
LEKNECPNYDELTWTHILREQIFDAKVREEVPEGATDIMYQSG